MRPLTYSTILLLAFGVSAYAVLSYLVLPGYGLNESLRASFDSNRLALQLHVAGAALALLIGASQLTPAVRRRPALHRSCGRLYFAGVIVGGLAGLYLAPRSVGGSVAHWGFGLLAALWVATAVGAWHAARLRQFKRHRAWVLRNVALTFAAITLRIYLPATLAAGVSFELAYPVIAWVAWVPNLIVAEWVIRSMFART